MFTIINILKLSFLLAPCWSFSYHSGHGAHNRSIVKRSLGDGETCTRSSADLDTSSLDPCLEAHEACEHYVDAGLSKFGIHNPGGFRISACACDIALKECLEVPQPKLSMKFAKKMFFEVLAPPCLEEVYDWAEAKLKKAEQWSMHELQSAAHAVYNDLHTAVKDVATDLEHIADSFLEMLW